MKYVLDASVAVAAMKPSERTYPAARRRVTRLHAREDEMVVPALFPIEVTSALARAGLPEAMIELYVQQLLARARVVTLGPKTAHKVARVAVQTRLRAADATYAWLAAREDVPLVTSDQEVLTCTAGLCRAELP